MPQTRAAVLLTGHMRYFGGLLADRARALYVSCRVKLTSLAALGNVYEFRNGYALAMAHRSTLTR